MSDAEFEGGEADLEQRFSDLENKSYELSRQCLFRSENRIAQEIRRLAKAEGKLIPYIGATFTLMNHSADLLDPAACRDHALEMIGLLESEDQARKIEANLPEAEYQDCVHWYSSCGYDNLAKATAALHGQNSDGTHACIADGIEICRRTGKTQCITCFREYATNVYIAADDVEMAEHYATVGLRNENPGPHDRRWAGARDLVVLAMASGRLKAAVEGVEQLINHCLTWHSPRRAKLLTKLLLGELGILIGEPDRWAEVFSDEDPVAADEFPFYEMRKGRLEALHATAEGDFAKASKLLSQWDTRLSKASVLDEWFEIRLRLIAVETMAGNSQQAERLAKQCRAKAESARDWMTLRCLGVLQNGRPAPLPFLQTPDIGPWAKVTEAVSQDATTAAANEHGPENESSEEASQPPELAARIWQRLHQAYSEHAEDEARAAETEKLLDEVISNKASDIADADEKCGLIAIVSYLLGDGKRASDVWSWANTLKDSIGEHAKAMNLVADLGATLLFGHEEHVNGMVQLEKLEEMFRRSLELDPNNARNFSRAGDFFKYCENIGEAEKCYARSFRLDRTFAKVAENLAWVYRVTDRQRDALAVLDLAIRSGAEEPSLFWAAAMSADSLSKHENTLTYLDEYRAITEGTAWVELYRSKALLQLRRPQESLDAITAEEKIDPERPWIFAVHRAIAHAQLSNDAEFEAEFKRVLSLPLYEIDYLTESGISNAFEMLFDCCRTNAIAKRKLRDSVSRIAESGCVSDEILVALRKEMLLVEPRASKDLYFFICEINQPLDENWSTFRSRMPGEPEASQQYTINFGVLAEDQGQAEQLCLEWQLSAYSKFCEVTKAEQQSGPYEDHAGIVWISERTHSQP